MRNELAELWRADARLSRLRGAESCHGVRAVRSELDQAIRVEAVIIVAEEIARLPEAPRTVLILRDFYHVSLGAIALRFGEDVTRKMVHAYAMKLKRARSRLGALLVARLGEQEARTAVCDADPFLLEQLVGKIGIAVPIGTAFSPNPSIDRVDD